MNLRIVLDVDALLVSLRPDRAGRSILLQLGRGPFDPCVSAPMLLEYEYQAKQRAPALGLAHVEIDIILDYLCAASHHVPLSRLWRPVLDDPCQDLVLATASAGECDIVVAQRFPDFSAARERGFRVMGPGLFLGMLGRRS